MKHFNDDGLLDEDRLWVKYKNLSIFLPFNVYSSMGCDLLIPDSLEPVGRVEGRRKFNFWKLKSDFNLNILFNDFSSEIVICREDDGKYSCHTRNGDWIATIQRSASSIFSIYTKEWDVFLSGSRRVRVKRNFFIQNIGVYIEVAGILYPLRVGLERNEKFRVFFDKMPKGLFFIEYLTISIFFRFAVFSFGQST